MAPPPLRVGILGGGITGLSTAFYLRKALGTRGRGVDIVLLEGSARLGGWIESKVYAEDGHPCDGFLFECGPRSFRPQKNGIHVLQLAEELGIHTDAVLAPKGLPRLIYTDNAIHPLPSSVLGALRSPLLQKAVPAVLKEPFFATERLPPVTSGKDGRIVEDDESIHAFISRRFSPYMAEQFLDPMVVAIPSQNPPPPSFFPPSFLPACLPQ
jgi:oxygen-dependent protoporphyrinogen oxidase